MDALTEFCSLLCGQQRCFAVDGELLPLCQRCLGLYAGALFTGAYLLLSRAWRRGLPPARLIVFHSALFLIALAGGLHWYDPGAAGRFLLGLWTGHVALIWLAAGCSALGMATRSGIKDFMSWRPIDVALSLVLTAVLSGSALFVGQLLGWGFYCWVSIIVLGMLTCGVALVLVALMFARVVVRSLHLRLSSSNGLHVQNR